MNSECIDFTCYINISIIAEKMFKLLLQILISILNYKNTFKLLNILFYKITFLEIELIINFTQKPAT